MRKKHEHFAEQCENLGNVLIANPMIEYILLSVAIGGNNDACWPLWYEHSFDRRRFPHFWKIVHKRNRDRLEVNY